MIVRSLWGWRKSEDIPELMEAWDEYSVESNDQGWDEACQRAITSWGDDLYVHRYINLTVDLDKVVRAFEPSEVNAEIDPTP